MPKISGKDLEFWFDGKEYPVLSVSFSEEFDQLEATDTSTPGDGKDFELGRANREISVEMFLYTPDGAEINSGTLVAGKKYRVTAKSTVLTAYDIGQIFVANGTEVMSANDKVVPLGDRITGKDMSFSFNSVTVPVTDADVSINYDTQDSTDTSTVGDASEVGVSRAERESKISLIAKSEDTDLLTTNPTAQSATLTFKTGQTISGQAIPVSKNIADETLGLAKVDYSFKWKGAPTETALGLPTAQEKTFKIILKRGASTNKQYTGNAIITSKQITSNVKELTKMTLGMFINGAVTYAVAN